MLNRDVLVPDNTVAVFIDETKLEGYLNPSELSSVIRPSPKKREWFNPHFYKCLPLSVANTYGFIIVNQYPFQVTWNGTDGLDAIEFAYQEPHEKILKKHPKIGSHFGFGVVSIDVPFSLRTPPGVNLMTINPPNVILPNITVLSGVVESDNLRRNFSFNLKIQIPNITITIPENTPLAGVIPIPRGFADSFNLVLAEELFDDETIVEELQASVDANLKREVIELSSKNRVGRDYLLGKDVYGNLFNDHQLSTGNIDEEQ